MATRIRSWFAIPLVVVPAALATVPSFAKQAPPTEPSLESLREGRVALAISAPSSGKWTMVLTNRDTVPARVLADARRLTLLVRAPNTNVYVPCSLPGSMQGAPTARMLELAPGASYTEEFDAHLFCFGAKSPALGEGASVTGFLGWMAPPKAPPTRKPLAPPFAVEPTQSPAAFRPSKQLVSLTTWLGQSPPPPAKGDAPQPGYGTHHLTLETPLWLDAANDHAVNFKATVRNLGDRPARAHFRPDDLEVRITSPTGHRTTCGPATSYRGRVPDFSRPIGPKATSSVSMLLDEICPPHTFAQPGLYAVTARLRVLLDSPQGTVDRTLESHETTRVRVQATRSPYHHAPPAPDGSETTPDHR